MIISFDSSLLILLRDRGLCEGSGVRNAGQGHSNIYIRSEIRIN